MPISFELGWGLEEEQNGLARPAPKAGLAAFSIVDLGDRSYPPKLEDLRLFRSPVLSNFVDDSGLGFAASFLEPGCGY